MTFVKLPMLLAAAATIVSTSQNQLRSFPQGVGSALYDGNCTYAVGDPSFDVYEYAEKPWYQLAVSNVPFEAGCECVYAKYAVLSDETGISVQNVCSDQTGKHTVNGVAKFAPPAYGPAALVVSFPGSPQFPDNCAGPNYVVQKIYRGVNKELVAAIVVSTNFEDWFLLSRPQVVDIAKINNYLSDIAKLGSLVSGNYNITVQKGCPVAT